MLYTLTITQDNEQSVSIVTNEWDHASDFLREHHKEDSDVLTLEVVYEDNEEIRNYLGFDEAK